MSKKKKLTFSEIKKRAEEKLREQVSLNQDSDWYRHTRDAEKDAWQKALDDLNQNINVGVNKSKEVSA